jgi:hypothetical protein
MSGLFEAKPVPGHITCVTGCNCGGLNAHLTTCSFWDLEPAEQLANTDQAHERLDAYTAELNARLHAALGVEQAEG